MGIPLKLVAMVNANDIVHRTVTSGDFSMAANVTQTLAPAIDIQVLIQPICPLLNSSHIPTIYLSPLCYLSVVFHGTRFRTYLLS